MKPAVLERSGNGNRVSGDAAPAASAVHVHMGTILCAHCGDIVDTFDAEKVMVYYSVCCTKDDCGTSL